MGSRGSAANSLTCRSPALECRHVGTARGCCGPWGGKDAGGGTPIYPSVIEGLFFWVSLWNVETLVKPLGKAWVAFAVFFSCGLQSHLVPSVWGARGGRPAQTNPGSLHPPSTSPPPGGHQDPNPQHPRTPTTNCKLETHCNAKPRCSAKR